MIRGLLRRPQDGRRDDQFAPAAREVSGDVHAVHVERTGEPTMLRWVCHCNALGEPGPRRPEPGASSPLAEFVHHGDIDAIWVHDGDLLVTTGPLATWDDLAPQVNAAIIAELGDLPGWLTRPAADPLVHDGSGPQVRRPSVHTPSVAEVQAEVDLVAGPTAASHGGRIEVVEVTGEHVRIVMQGACHGCAGSSTTMNTHVRTAVNHRWPHLRVSDEAETVGRVSLRRTRSSFPTSDCSAPSSTD